MRPARHRLPDGFQARVRDDVTITEGPRPGERVLIGGSPLRAVRLTPAATSLLNADGRVLTVRDSRSAALARRLLDGNIADPVPTPPPPAQEVTVVIPVKDRPAQLDRCLDALAGLAVIVVDDASDDQDATRSVVRRHGARLLALPVNRGPAAARNAGLARVRTPYVAFVDSDVTVGPPVLLRLAAHFTDPAVALVGPIVLGVTRSARPRWFERYDAACSSLSLGQRACCVYPGAAVGWLPSSCVVARTGALTEASIHGFDQHMRVGEDVDLVWRLVGHGWRVRYDPTCQAHHDARTTMAEWLSRKVLYGTGGAPLAARHVDATAAARLSPTMAAAGAALLLRRMLALPVTTVAVGMAAHTLRRSLPSSVNSTAIAKIAVRGLGWTLMQESALLLRHWWPATLAAGLLPAHAGGHFVRRAVVTALVVDTIAAFTIDKPLQWDLPYRVGPVAMLVGHRLDDLAYGAGLWAGSLRHRSLRALAVKIAVNPRPSQPAAAVWKERRWRPCRNVGCLLRAGCERAWWHRRRALGSTTFVTSRSGVAGSACDAAPPG